MSDPLTLRIITEGGVVVDEPASSLRVPAALGYLGVLRNHAPLVTTVTPGILRLKRGDGTLRLFSVGEGIFEVSRNHCTLLTTRAEALQEELA